jgi:NMD protein affecting ribosome stability and mRNA decay
MASGICSECGEFTPKLLKGQCRTCYTYEYRNGVRRPEEVRVAHARRFNERQAEREVVSRYVYEYN